MDIGEVDYKLLFHHTKNDTAQHRAPNRPDAANHRDQQNIDAGLKRKYVAGINECVIACIKTACYAGERGAYGMNPEL